MKEITKHTPTMNETFENTPTRDETSKNKSKMEVTRSMLQVYALSSLGDWDVFLHQPLFSEMNPFSKELAPYHGKAESYLLSLPYKKKKMLSQEVKKYIHAISTSKNTSLPEEIKKLIEGISLTEDENLKENESLLLFFLREFDDTLDQNIEKQSQEIKKHFQERFKNACFLLGKTKEQELLEIMKSYCSDMMMDGDYPKEEKFITDSEEKFITYLEEELGITYTDVLKGILGGETIRSLIKWLEKNISTTTWNENLDQNHTLEAISLVRRYGYLHGSEPTLIELCKQHLHEALFNLRTRKLSPQQIELLQNTEEAICTNIFKLLETQKSEK